MMTDAETLRDVLERLGVTNHTNIVIYDNAGMMSSFVVWYTLSVHGIERVSVLDGGLAAWKASGYGLEQGGAEQPADGEGHLEPLKRCQQRLRTLEQMKVNLHKAEPTQVLDARSAERFHARVPEPRPGLRSGHIPGSINVPWTSLVRVQQGIPAFKEPTEIRRQFFENGVQLGPKQSYIVSCGSGVTAAVLAFALFRIGTPLENISLYDGSWSEWGQEGIGTPVETD